MSLDTIELMTAICELVCEGYPAAEIAGNPKKNIDGLLVERYGEGARINREGVYYYLLRAANEGWLDCEPPSEPLYNQFIRDRYKWLSEVDVVNTAEPRHVGKRTAKVILDILKEYAGRERVHIGLAGGIAVRHVVSELAKLLSRPIPYDQLPERLEFHSLVAGFALGEEIPDPGAFFRFFEEKPAIRIPVSFVRLSAPAIIRPEELPRLHGVEGIEGAFRAKKNIDIIVTGGADWHHKKHALLRKLMAKEDPDSLTTLKELGCVGDLLWRPIGESGPIEVETAVRAFTLFELRELTGLIKKGKHVVLSLGPCGRCGRPKGQLLRTTLDHKKRLVTHVITDSRSAGEVYMHYHGVE